MTKVTPDLRVLKSEMDAVADEMRNVQRWRSTEAGDGRAAFGREFDRQLGVKMQNKPGWVYSVYVKDVNGVKTIVSIGAPPAGGVAGTTQVDMVRMADGVQKFQPNDVWDPAKVKTIHEVKTSVSGRIVDPDQRTRLLELTGGAEEKLIATQSEWHYEKLPNGTDRWVRNPQYKSRHRAYQLMGTAATAGAALLPLVLIEDFQQIVDRAIFIRNREAAGIYSQGLDGPIEKRQHVAEWVGMLCDYMEGYGADTDMLRAGFTYAIMLEIISLQP